jgi:hypothetical protein
MDTWLAIASRRESATTPPDACPLVCRRHLAFPSTQRVDTDGGPPPRSALAAGQKDFDCIHDRVDVTEPRPMI